jgi:hypothetical protein
MDVTAVNLPDHRQQAVKKHSVAFRTANPASAYNIAERRAAAFAAHIVVFRRAIKKFMHNIADPVAKACKQISASELPGTLRAKGQFRYLSA